MFTGISIIIYSLYIRIGRRVGGLVPFSSSDWARGGVHPEQFASPSQIYRYLKWVCMEEKDEQQTKHN